VFAQLIGPAIDEYHASLVSVSGAHLAIGGVSGSAGSIKAERTDLPPPYTTLERKVVGNQRAQPR
jgi:hypothetical protein